MRPVLGPTYVIQVQGGADVPKAQARVGLCEQLMALTIALCLPRPQTGSLVE